MTRMIALGMLWWSVLAVSGETERYFEEARAYLARGETRAAVIQLKNLLRRDPLHVEGRLLLGEAYLRLGNQAGAVKELKRARDLKADPGRWLVPLARAYLAGGQMQQLLEEIQPRPALPPGVRAELMALRGRAQLALGRREEARAAFTQALELVPDNATGRLGKAHLALLEKQAQVARQEAERILKQSPDHIDAWLVVAESRRLELDWEGAADAFAEVLKRNPGEIRALAGRAAVLLAQNRPDAARQDLDQARQLAGDLPLVSYLEGLLEFQAGNLQAAEDALLQVVSATPHHLPSRLLLGVIAYRQNELASAEEYLTAVHRQMPDYAPVVKLLAAVKLKRRQPEAAVSLLEPYRAKYAKDPQFLAILGSAYLHNRQFDQGTELLTEAVRLAPQAAAIRTQLAVGQIAAGELEQAVNQLEQAVTEDPELIQAEVMLVLAQLRQKKYAEALLTARQLANKMPADPMPANLIAAIHLAKGERQKAEDQWKEILARYPDHPIAALNLAGLKFRQGQTAEAEHYYRQVLKHQPGHLAALIGLAQIAEARNDDGSMVDWLEAARAHNPAALQPALMLARYYLARQEHLKALGVMRGAVEKHPDDPRVLQTLGQAQLAADQANSAVATFRRLTARFPGDPQAHYLLGLALAVSGDEKAALESWETALELKEDFLPAASDRIRLLLRQKRHQEALAAARRLQDRFPGRPIGYFWEGEAALGANRFDQALRAHRKAYELGPSAVIARRLYQLYRHKGDPAGANQLLEEWLRRSPGDRDSWIMLAMGYQSDAERQRAIEAYRKAQALDADNQVVLNNLAWLYQEAGDPKALILAERLAAKAGGNPEMLDTVGWIFSRHGRVQEGLTLLREAAVRAPHLPAIQVHLAEVLMQAGDRQEARNVLQRLLRERRQFAEREHAQELLDTL